MWASFPGECFLSGLRTVWTGDVQDGSDASCGGGQTFRIKHIPVVSQWMGAWSPVVGHVSEVFPHCVPGLVTGSCRPPPWSDEAAGVFQSTRVFFLNCCLHRFSLAHTSSETLSACRMRWKPDRCPLKFCSSGPECSCALSLFWLRFVLLKSSQSSGSLAVVAPWTLSGQLDVEKRLPLSSQMNQSCPASPTERNWKVEKNLWAADSLRFKSSSVLKVTHSTRWVNIRLSPSLSYTKIKQETGHGDEDEVCPSPLTFMEQISDQCGFCFRTENMISPDAASDPLSFLQLCSDSALWSCFFNSSKGL